MLSGTYPSASDRSNLEVWNQIGRTSVEQTRAQAFPVLVSVYRLGATKWSHGQIFRKEGGAGLCMRHGTMIQGFTSPGSTIDMLIHLGSLVFRLALLKSPATMNAASV